jgi:hypothetical protein
MNMHCRSGGIFINICTVQSWRKTFFGIFAAE